MNKRYARSLVWISCAFLSSPSMFSQTGSAAIAGTVSDTEGRALAKAGIQVTNLQTGISYKTDSAAQGNYAFAQLPAGAYTLSAFVPGMLPFQRPNIVLSAAATVRTDITLGDIQLNTLGEDREFLASLMTPHKAPSGPAPRTSDGRPDLSGVWAPSFPVDPGKPEPLPWAASLSRERIANNLKDLPTSRCLPGAITQTGMFVYYKLVQTPALLVVISEGDLPRQVFLDGRGHPRDANPTWLGHSIGRWEGDTLVVDSIGFNDRTWLAAEGYPHTEMMHVVQKYRRPDFGHLETEITIEDPGAFAKPWTIKKVSALAPNDEITEIVCTENNRDLEHLVGK
jgi:Carboxypeptidase regulatory-like domain